MLETKIFHVGGTKLGAESSLSKFRATKEANGDYKLIIELTIDGKVGSKLKEFEEFGASEEAVDKMPGMVYFERFDPAVAGSDGVEKAEVVITHDTENLVMFSANVYLPGGGKTQSAF